MAASVQMIHDPRAVYCNSVARRTTPRAYELMPEILQILKAETQSGLKKKDIVSRLKPFIDGRGYRERPHATGFGLKYLFNEGYLSRPKRGFWAITESGSTASVDEDWGRAVTDKYETRGH
jgi:hypothetical protein